MSVVAWIALAILLLAVFLFFKFRKFRGFVFLTLFAALLGMIFGPPSYVVHEGYTTTLRNDPTNTRYHYAWAVNKLAPTEAKRAKLGIYNSETGEFQRFNEELAKSANLAFIPPSQPAWLLNIWWWIFPATYLAFYIQRRFGLLASFGGVFYFARRNKNCQEKLDFARQQRTIWAYEDALKLFQSYRFKPKRFIEQATQESAAIYQTYKLRVQTLQKLYRNAAETLQNRDVTAFTKAGKLFAIADFMGLLGELLHDRERTQMPNLALEITLDKNWHLFSPEHRKFVGYSSITELENTKLNQIEERWRREISSAQPISQLTEYYAQNVKSFEQQRDNVRTKESAQNYVSAELAAFWQMAESQLAGELTEQNRVSAQRYANDYFINRLFKAVSDPTAFKYFHQSFEKNLSKTLAIIFSSYFPEEQWHGRALFTEQKSESIQQRQLLFKLIPTGRLTGGAPTVESEVSQWVGQQTVWVRRLNQPQLPNRFKSKADAFGDITATAMLRDAFNTRKQIPQPNSHKVTELAQKHVLDELNETVKELAHGVGEDLALELINQIIDGNGVNAIIQFEQVVDSELSSLVFNSLENAASLFEAGLGFLGGDD